MFKFQKVQRLLDAGLVGIVRTDEAKQAIRVAEAIQQGGCTALEITFTIPGAHRVLENLAARFKPGEMMLGAGTVLDAETARIAILSGAQFVVAPSLDIETIKLCHRHGAVVIPGAMTVNEVVAAMEAGADLVKLFPGETLGPSFLKALRGPLPHAPILPTGVNPDRIADWIRAGAVGVGIGGALTEGAKHGDYASITCRAREFLDAIRAARAGLEKN